MSILLWQGHELLAGAGRSPESVPQVRSRRLALMLCVTVGAALAAAPRSAANETGSVLAASGASAAAATEPVRGLLVPLQHATLSSRLQATILSIGPDNGERFAAGDALVTFDCEAFEAELARAEAQVEGAKAAAAAKSELARSGSASRLQAVLAQADVKRAEAEVRLANKQVSECKLPAPYGGRVIKRIANAHETVGYRDPLIEIVADEALEVRAFVPSRWLRTIAPAMAFRFTVDETGDVLEVTIRALGAAVDNVSGLVEIRGAIAAAPAHLAAGMSGTADFPQMR